MIEHDQRGENGKNKSLFIMLCSEYDYWAKFYKNSHWQNKMINLKSKIRGGL